MDEILIGEKNYVSSKRAAKITGYAKDYIGQLCREGRVPARLVGRSWYVLETAIQDHRFGTTDVQAEKATKAQPPVSPWESPRYESSPDELLPSVNRLNKAPEHLQDSWRAWFDRVADTEPVGALPEAARLTPESKEEGQITPDIREEAVNIPVHTVYDLPPEDLLPHRVDEDSVEESALEEPRGGRRGLIRTIQVAGALIAVSVAMMAILGTGYFDTYIILSNSQARVLAGVVLYNK